MPETPRMRAMASRKVEDLALDPRLLVMLAAELVRWASRRWAGTVA